MSKGNLRENLPLTAERARQLWRYDPDTGVLIHRFGRGKKAGSAAGTRNTLYVTVYADGIPYRAHRVIWLMQKGKWPDELIDHIDGNGRNNRWRNLRQATFKENARNKRPSKNCKSGIVGVSPAGDKWCADIGVDGKIIHLGQFECVEAAASARCAAERHYFGDFARQARRYPPDAAE